MWDYDKHVVDISLDCRQFNFRFPFQPLVLSPISRCHYDNQVNWLRLANARDHSNSFKHIHTHIQAPLAEADTQGAKLITHTHTNSDADGEGKETLECLSTQ